MVVFNILFVAFYIFVNLLATVWLKFLAKDYDDEMPEELKDGLVFAFDEFINYTPNEQILQQLRGQGEMKKLNAITSIASFRKWVNRLYLPLSLAVICMNTFL